KKCGESLSEKERTAEDVSRAVNDVVMCRYMSKFVGSVYSGIISGVTESNIYVELDNGVEGSIYLSVKGSPKGTIDMARGSLRDISGKEIYRIGEKIQVKIASVDMEARRIEMETLSV
ncbi:S1 RNA-binding domain-containing protein, partial [Candidatus Gracilibacteria bacterium]|nr:S1 RNA-binding domain-containing protein [Candidatus Gracilibacteria bacterium]